MLISEDRTAMGEYANGNLARFLGWGTAALMSASAIAYLVLNYG
jgi:hypothetical protein